MKQYLYILCAMIAGIFASCSKSEIESYEANSTSPTILKVTTNNETQTRARAVDRYVMEIYTDETYTTPANILTDGTNKTSNATGEFQMVLDRTKAYYCLLWADIDGSAAYNVSNLKAVGLQANQKPAEAWHGTYKIEAGTNATLTTELKRAVAKLTLLETGIVLPNSSLTVAFNQPTTFNVATTAVLGTTVRTEIINLAAGITGTQDIPARLNETNIYVLSSKTGDVKDLTFTMSMNGTSEPSFSVTNVPLQSNYNSNVKGHYTTLHSSVFTVTCDDLWKSVDE